jgi:hypothetical protein
MGHLITPPEEELEKTRPKHLDFEVMRILVNRMDDHPNGPEYLAEIVGRPLDEIMDSAIVSCMAVAKSKNDSKGTVLLLMGMGGMENYVNYFRAGWLAGLCEGLEEKRGIEIPSDFHLVGNLFWDLDGKSVQYVVDQRIIRIVASNLDSEQPHPFVAMAAAWLDGYAVGIQFDELKEEMLAKA